MEIQASPLQGGGTSGEVLVGLSCAPERVVPAAAIRSTTLISSLLAIDRAGKLSAYHQLVPRQYIDTLTTLVAGSWLPMEVGIAHYATVAQLGFSNTEARDNGRLVAQLVQNSHFAVLVRALGSTVTLWSVLPRIPTFIGRLIQGGECAVYRSGPKDARVELHGMPIAQFDYVRNGWAGMLEGTLGLLVRKVYARDLSPSGTKSVAVFSLSWA